MPESLLEFARVGGTVDRDAGVIRGVKVLGAVSKNGREYSQAAMSQAARMYEGLDVNVNHPDRSKPNSERKIEDAFGWLEAVQIKSDGVYADLHYLREHPSAGLVAEAAERRSTRMGLSHNATGSVHKVNGKNVVESIDRVLSVDLVQNPATNAGLFESQQRTIREVLEQHAPEALAALLEDGALLPPEAMDEPMAPTGPEVDATATVKAAMAQIITAMLDLPGDLRQMCSQLVPVFQKIIGGQPEPADPNAEPEVDENGEPIAKDDPAAEPGQGSPFGKSPESAADATANPEAGDSASDPQNPFKKKEKNNMAEAALSTKERQELETLREENAQLKTQLEHKNLREQCEALLRKHNREVTPAYVTALANMPGEAERQQLIEELPAVALPEKDNRPRKPNFMSPPAERNDSAYPSSVKDLVEACR